MSGELKSFASPWKGRLVLACKKCQKKLKDDGDLAGLAKLKKAVKKKQSAGLRLHVLNVPCMDICPKNAVAVVDPRRGDRGLYILRGEDDIDSLIETVARS